MRFAGQGQQCSCMNFHAFNLVHEKIDDDEQECWYAQQPGNKIFNHQNSSLIF